MFVPLFPFPVPIPLIGEQLLPPNRPALPCTPRTPHRACSSFFCWIRERLSAACSAAPPPRMPQTLYPLHQYR